MTAPESIAASINQIDEKKQNLKKAFDDLQAHRSLLSPSFNLSWSEIDSHFSSLQSSLLDRFRLLQSAAPPPDSDKIEASTAETTLVWPELRKFCEKNDGIGLGKYMIDNSKKRLSINLELRDAIRCAENPAALVLDAIEGCYHCSSPSSSSSSSARAIGLRRIFVLLLEDLIEINANLTNDLRERARTLAYNWKLSIGNKPSEALAFLHLVAAFELGSLFSNEELCDYIFLITKYKQVTTISRKIGLDRKKIAELIKKFLHTGRLLVAIKFIYENEMTGEFEPVSILKTSLKNSRAAAKRVCAEGSYSLKAQNEGTDKELNALRAVIKVVKEKSLESEFVEEKLEECVKELEDQKAQRKRATKFTSPANNNTQQPQQQVDNKRPRVGNGSTTGYNLTVPPMSQQQQPLLPNPSHGVQVNQYGLLSSMLPGVSVPYGNPLAPFGSVPVPGPASQPVYFEQQTGYGGYGLPPQYHPPYYSQ
ncbi:PREDICTED: FRIGIDA-like protein 2 [Camelina sativa]|uniref:FRIGIDA-like protein n=1 Tax=Camelina sativa TaxID=90675 RepID=A0ABM0YEH1_CAMSA|nr:PREDICTED: FRIGIDA-like protein 2 [Camelina sativa]